MNKRRKQGRLLPLTDKEKVKRAQRSVRNNKPRGKAKGKTFGPVKEGD